MSRLVAGAAGALLFGAVEADAATFYSRSFTQAVMASCPGITGGGGCGYTTAANGAYIPVGAQTYVEQLNAFDRGTASRAAVSPAYGSGVADVLRDGRLFPTLKAGSFTANSASGGTASGYSVAYARYAYEYRGARTIALPLAGAIDSIISFGNARPFAFAYGQVTARLAVIDPAAVGEGLLHPSTLVCGRAGVLAAASDFVSRGKSASGGTPGSYESTLSIANGCDGNAFTINPGQKIFIVAGMDTYAQRGASTDATHTFTIDFDRNASAQAIAEASAGLDLSTSVPEPATWAIMIFGFGIIGGAARRERLANASRCSGPGSLPRPR